MDTRRPPAARRIAICIDDYGLHEGVNAAALALAGDGRVQAISCMVGAPAWPTGAPRLAGLQAGLVDVGLHLDLLDFPLRLPPSALPRLLVRSYARLLPRPALRAEIEAQFDAFERALGRAPAYVDGHQHVHQFPQVRELLVEVLRARYPRQRPWLRSTRRPSGAGLPGGSKPWVIERLGSAALRRLASRNGFAQNTGLLGVYGFDTDAAGYQALLDLWLRLAREGDLLMCHAATQPGPQDPIAAARCAEYEVLAGPAFADGLARAGVRLAPISRLEHAKSADQAASL